MQMVIDLLNIQWGPQGIFEMSNIHPIFVHFPIALLLVALAFYLLGTVFKKEELLGAGKWALYFGTLAAAVAVWTGLQAAETVFHGGEIHKLMTVHQYLGFAILGLSAVLSLWVLISKANMPRKGRMLFLILLFMLAGLVLQGADLGGRLVFLHGVGVGKKSAAHEATSHEHGGHELGHASHSDNESPE